jgi:hypothetical protein
MTDQKKLTIREFKMWLQGVQEMQEPNWTPTAAQWAKIYEKINNIDDASPVYNPPLLQPAQIVTHRAVEQAGMSPTTLSLAGPPSLPPVAPPRPGAVNPLFGGPKTPDIDTSTGKGYESGFV